jgi:hypothetical protein
MVEGSASDFLAGLLNIPDWQWMQSTDIPQYSLSPDLH